MNFQQLTTFCTVLSEGSMTAAAEKLFLTQPAVSQQIRNLEEELKVDLLLRGSVRPDPPPKGRFSMITQGVLSFSINRPKWPSKRLARPSRELCALGL